MLTKFEVLMRERLLELSQQLGAEDDDQAAAVVELDQSRQGRLSRMDAMQAQAMAQASDRRREAMLRRVASALARLDRGEYGACQICEQAIPPKRLEFDPATTLCIVCAEQAEH